MSNKLLILILKLTLPTLVETPRSANPKDGSFNAPGLSGVKNAESTML